MENLLMFMISVEIFFSAVTFVVSATIFYKLVSGRFNVYVPEPILRFVKVVSGVCLTISAATVGFSTGALVGLLR